MNIYKEYIPYTYLIGWSKIDQWYYGVQFANSKNRVANPSNLWTTYFTSSKTVRQYREMYGEPDIIQIRRTFITADAAFNWEQRVIHKVISKNPKRWINCLTIISKNNYNVKYTVELSDWQRAARSIVMKEVANKRVKKSCEEHASNNPRSAKIIDLLTGEEFESIKRFMAYKNISNRRVQIMEEHGLIEIIRSTKIDETRFPRSRNIWITKDCENLSIKPEELDEYINCGWIRGRYVPKKGRKIYRCSVCDTVIGEQKRTLCSKECRCIRFKQVAAEKSPSVHKRTSKAMNDARWGAKT